MFQCRPLLVAILVLGGGSRDRTYLPEATGLQPARTPLFHFLHV